MSFTSLSSFSVFAKILNTFCVSVTCHTSNYKANVEVDTRTLLKGMYKLLNFKLYFKYSKTKRDKESVTGSIVINPRALFRNCEFSWHNFLIITLVSCSVFFSVINILSLILLRLYMCFV